VRWLTFVAPALPVLFGLGIIAAAEDPTSPRENAPPARVLSAQSAEANKSDAQELLRLQDQIAPSALTPGAEATRRSRASILPGSVIRFRKAFGKPGWIRAERITGQLQLDERGIPCSLAFSADLEQLVGDGDIQCGQLAWQVLGKGRSEPLRFEAGRREARIFDEAPNLPGDADERALAELEFTGSLSVAGRRRHERIHFFVINVAPRQLRLMARTSTLASDFDLPGARSTFPHGAEPELIVVMDLRFGMDGS
jgi:hypothetical protein